MHIVSSGGKHEYDFFFFVFYVYVNTVIIQLSGLCFIYLRAVQMVKKMG